MKTSLKLLGSIILLSTLLFMGTVGLRSCHQNQIDLAHISPLSDYELSKTNIQNDVRALSADRLQGRSSIGPMAGEVINYISEDFEKTGLQYTEKDSFLQPVEFYRYSDVIGQLSVIEKNGDAVALDGNDVLFRYKKSTKSANLVGKEAVFVGFGIISPEIGRNDYKGENLKGKVAVILSNRQDPKLLHDTKLDLDTYVYYSSREYKLEEAARQGAVGAIFIEDANYGGYNWQPSTQRPNRVYTDIAYPDSHQGIEVEVKMGRKSAQDLFKYAGLDFDQLASSYLDKSAKSTNLGLILNINVSSKLTSYQSYNVVGMVEGSVRPDEIIICLTSAPMAQI